MVRDLPDRLGFTSAVSGEGASFLSRSLALILANDVARRVCIVDLNWWSPSEWPEEGEMGGMADVARGMLSVEDALIPTTNPGLSYVPAGATTAAERPLLAHRPGAREERSSNSATRSTTSSSTSPPSAPRARPSSSPRTRWD